MFSTLVSLEDRLKVKTEISLCMAIMQNHPLPSLYTQYYPIAIPITQYGSTVYIGMAMGGSAL